MIAGILWNFSLFIHRNIAIKQVGSFILNFQRKGENMSHSQKVLISEFREYRFTYVQVSLFLPWGPLQFTISQNFILLFYLSRKTDFETNIHTCYAHDLVYGHKGCTSNITVIVIGNELGDSSLNPD